MVSRDSRRQGRPWRRCGVSSRPSPAVSGVCEERRPVKDLRCKPLAHPLLREPAVALELAPGRASDGRAAPCPPRVSGNPALNAHGAPTMSNELFTSDATGATRPASADEILEAASAILPRRVRRGAAHSNPRGHHLVARDAMPLRFAILLRWCTGRSVRALAFAARSSPLRRCGLASTSLSCRSPGRPPDPGGRRKPPAHPSARSPARHRRRERELRGTWTSLKCGVAHRRA
jgi:hypothetical protein